MPTKLTHEQKRRAIRARAERRKRESLAALQKKRATQPTFTLPPANYSEDALTGQNIILDEKPNELLNVRSVVKSTIGPTKVTVYNVKTRNTDTITLRKERKRLGLSPLGRRVTGKAFRLAHAAQTRPSGRGRKRHRQRRTRRHKKTKKNKKKK